MSDAVPAWDDLPNITRHDRLAASPDPDDNLRAMLIDWDEFWAADHVSQEWLWQPIIAAQRAHAIFAPGGVGKSLVALRLIIDMIAAGHVVLYFDYEMTPDDLYDRLEDMGLDEHSDLTRLHYAQLPDIDPLDVAEGGATVRRLAELVGADLVVIDTFARAVSGDENEAQTVREFYRWTGIHLKADGRAFIRLDHAGKDLDKGQRGSSAKNDDVDVVWRLERTDTGYRFLRKKARMGWVPETVLLQRHDDPFRVELVNRHDYPAGTREVAALLDGLGVPDDATTRKAREALNNAGEKASNEALRGAVKYRRERSATMHFADDLAITVREKSPRSVEKARRNESGAHLDRADGTAEPAQTARTANPLLDDSAQPPARSGAHDSADSARSSTRKSAARRGPDGTDDDCDEQSFDDDDETDPDDPEMYF